MHRKFSHSKPLTSDWLDVNTSSIRLRGGNHPVSPTPTDWLSTCRGKFFTCRETKWTSFNGRTCLIPGMCLCVFHCAAIVRPAVKSLMKALMVSRAPNQSTGLLRTTRACRCELIRARWARGRCVNPARLAADPRDPAGGTPDKLFWKACWDPPPAGAGGGSQLRPVTLFTVTETPLFKRFSNGPQVVCVTSVESQVRNWNDISLFLCLLPLITHAQPATEKE